MNKHTKLNSVFTSILTLLLFTSSCFETVHAPFRLGDAKGPDIGKSNVILGESFDWKDAWTLMYGPDMIISFDGKDIPLEFDVPETQGKNTPESISPPVFSAQYQEPHETREEHFHHHPPHHIEIWEDDLEHLNRTYILEVLDQLTNQNVSMNNYFVCWPVTYNHSKS